MSNYKKPTPNSWTGRVSNQKLYLHEKVEFLDIENDTLKSNAKTFALLGYNCDSGVKRNQGRIGAAKGPDVIKKQLAKMPNHLKSNINLFDIGNINCPDGDMEKAQNALADILAGLLHQKAFPILIGGGHDIAYGHYNGIKKHLNKKKTIGIINFDAHFDLRSNEKGNNSGTPFYQIANDCKNDKTPFNYMCLGIRKDANDRILFDTAIKLGVTYIENELFNLYNVNRIKKELEIFIHKVDSIYVTIDLDGFSSAYAMGVSASSSMGFSPDIVLECLRTIINSKKMISLDIAEMNPKYDIDNQTAKLAASLVHFVISGIPNN